MAISSHTTVNVTKIYSPLGGSVVVKDSSTLFLASNISLSGMYVRKYECIYVCLFVCLRTNTVPNYQPYLTYATGLTLDISSDGVLGGVSNLTLINRASLSLHRLGRSYAHSKGSYVFKYLTLSSNSSIVFQVKLLTRLG